MNEATRRYIQWCADQEGLKGLRRLWFCAVAWFRVLIGRLIGVFEFFVFTQEQRKHRHWEGMMKLSEKDRREVIARLRKEGIWL